MARTLTVFLVACACAACWTATAIAAPARDCGSVSYTRPGTDGEGRAALNNITTSGASCPTARVVAKDFLAGYALPAGWRAKPKTVTHHGASISEEIFTRGPARVIGDIAN
jgi:hypothetical protein